MSVKGEASYEPIQNKPILYGEVPDVGEPITVTGPMTIDEFLETISYATEWDILVSQEAQKIALQFWIAEATPKRALEILKFHDVYYEFDPEAQYLYVMTTQEYLDKEYGAVEHEEFTAQYVDVTYLESMISSLSSSKGRIITDPRTTHIYVWDTKDNLDKMRETVREIDVPLERAEFSVQHADIADIESIISSLLSPTGTLITDPRTGKIIVWDIPDSLNRMRQTLGKLDVPLESRVFKLRHVDASVLVESIEILLTERGLIQVDPRFNTLIVSDLPTRQSLIAQMIETLDKELETRTWVIKYGDPDIIAEEVEVLLPEDMGIITVNEDIHQITITALPERLDEIDKLIKTWDIKRKQVQIEAYLLTASSDIARRLGIDWAYFDSSGDAPFSIATGAAVPNYTAPGTGSGQRFQLGQLPRAIPLRNWVTGDPITDINGNALIEGFAENRISAVIDYLDDKGVVNVLSHPRVTVQDGAEAMFQRTSMVPYVTSTTYGYSGQYSQGEDRYYRPSNRIEFIEVGTILSVVPRIAEDGNILLDIGAEESTYQMREVVGASETSTVPEKMQNRAETQVLVHDSQTIVIGGLRTDNIMDSVQRVPFLGDIPLLGRVFRNSKKEHRNQELLVFITTSLVDEYTCPETERLAKVEETIGQTARHDQKNIWKRTGDEFLRGKNEIGISIGQSGHIHSGGAPATLEKLREKFFALSLPQNTTVVVREHPRAPSHVAREVTEIALEAGLKVEFDDRLIPFVPAYRQPEPEDVHQLAPAEENGETQISSDVGQMNETVAEPAAAG